jgi:sirohydrochlorin ferrochelatase
MGSKVENSEFIVAVWHGSKRPSWQIVIDDLMDYLKATSPRPVIGVAVDAVHAGLTAAYQRGGRQLTVLPLFTAPGGHVTDDIDQTMSAFSAEHPQVTLRRVPTLLELPAVREAIIDVLDSASI